MIFILIVILAILFLFMNTIFRDILRPSIGICVMFLVSTICAMVNCEMWQYSMSFDCAIVIITSIIIYSLVDLFVGSKKKSVCVCLPNVKDRIGVNSLIYVGSCLFIGIAGILYYRDIISITSQYGSFQTWSMAIRFYRNGGMTGNVVEGVSSLAANAYTLATAVAYVFAYIFVHNLVISRRDKKNYLNLFPVFLFSVDTVFTGGRLPLLRLIIAAVFVYLFLQYKTKKRKQINPKNFIKFLILGIVVLYGFASVSNLVGRTYDGNPIYYITSYLGGSIPLLDLFMENPVKHDIWGYETFPALLKFVGRLLDIDSLSSILVNKEFRSMSGYQIGNVYTALRAYISDFGYLGMGVMVFIHSFILSLIYKKMNRKQYTFGTIDTSVLMLMYIVHSVYMFSIDDRLFMSIVSIETVKMWIYFLILKWVFTDIKIGAAGFKIRVKGDMHDIKKSGNHKRDI